MYEESFVSMPTEGLACLGTIVHDLALSKNPEDPLRVWKWYIPKMVGLPSGKLT